MNFDFNRIETADASFGVCKRQKGSVEFFDVPVTLGVRAAIVEMAQSTMSAMQSVSELPTAYEPSEQYASGSNHLRVGLDDPIVAFYSGLQQVASFEPGGNILRREPRTIFCYFSKFTDSNGRNLIGIRRSASFKGVLSSRMLSFLGDELIMSNDNLFRLDNDFDVLVDDEQVCILRVKAFEDIGALQDAIRKAAAQNLEAFGNMLPFVNISAADPQSFNITKSRKLAAVNQKLDGITFDSLRKVCDDNGVPYLAKGSRLRFDEGSVDDLLDLLDRRLFNDELVPGELVRYRAGSRRIRT